MTGRGAVRAPLTADEAWVYLALTGEPAELSDALARLAARGGGAFVVLTPTRAAWRAWPPGLRGRATVIAMSDLFEFGGGPGALRVRDVAPAPAVPAPAAAPATGLLRVEEIRAAYPALTRGQVERVRKRLERWRERHEDQTMFGQEDPDTGRRRCAYPADAVARAVRGVLAAAGGGGGTTGRRS